MRIVHLLLLLAFAAPSWAQAIYKYVDKDGITTYTNLRPTNVRAGAKIETVLTYCLACNPRSTVNWNGVSLNTDDFSNEINAAAAEHGVSAGLVRAVIHAESGYNRWAISRANAQGLMQLIPATQTRFGVINPYSARENIQGGVQYLRWLLDRFEGNVDFVLAGYNAGEGAVARFGGIPPYAETQVYVQRVKILQTRYETALNPTTPDPAAAANPTIATAAQQ